MLVLLDFLPIIAFVAAFALTQDFMVATQVIMVAMPVTLAISFAITRKINKVHLISTALVVLFGGVTLLLGDSRYLAWKPTVFNWAFGIVCVGSTFIGSQPVMQRLMGGQIELAPPQWRALTNAWGVFFLVLGAVNLFVYYTFSESTWVYFKLWGLMGMTFAFAIAQGVWMTQAAARNERQAVGSNE